MGGCNVDFRYHKECMSPALSEYKRELFGRDDFILHTADIVRRSGPFQKLTNIEFRNRFYIETNRLMKNLEYMIIACVIRKDAHLQRYGIAAIDPYMLALRVLVERFVFEIKSCKGEKSGFIIAESRDETLDNQLRLAWMDLRTSGTEYIAASELRRHVTDLKIMKKSENIAGLQIADLVVSPIGRHILGKKPQEDWKIIQEKLRSNYEGRYMGFGLVILPKKSEAAPE
ncbi:MAG: DUF3800 domain-containing protein [Deltaproteobacteria bacterium]|nr:DUF3800 domain-containing protein [Deltaproteobacteria bacterium]